MTFGWKLNSGDDRENLVEATIRALLVCGEGLGYPQSHLIESLSLV
jgi:hypothetical protein